MLTDLRQPQNFQKGGDNHERVTFIGYCWSGNIYYPLQKDGFHLAQLSSKKITNKELCKENFQTHFPLYVEYKGKRRKKKQ